MEVDVLVAQWLESPDPQRLADPAQGDLARRVVEHLKAEADRHWAIDPNRSLELAGQIVAIGQARGEAGHIALGAMARGDALKFLGRNEEAWAALVEAGETFLAAGDEVGWARTCIGRLYLSPKLNRVAKTLAEAEQARAVFTAHNRLELRLRLDLNTALVYSLLGDQRRALAYYEPALDTAHALGQAGEPYLGTLLANIGVAHEGLGDLRRALAHYERARALFRAKDEPRSLVSVELNIVYIARAQGRYREALRMLHAVLERAAVYFPLEAALARLELAELYLHLNRFSEARELAYKVIEEYRAFGTSYDLARMLLHLTTAEAGLGNHAAARAALNQAEPILTDVGAGAWQAVARLWRGRLAFQQGDWARAQQAASCAAESFNVTGQEEYYAQAVLLQGQTALACGSLAEANAAGRKALQIAQRENIASLRYAAHLLLGRTAEAEGERVRAGRRYRAAAATTDRVQRRLTLTLRPGFLTDKGEALRRLISLQLQAGRAQEAFETLERSKSQVLLGYLANQGRLRWPRNDVNSQVLIDELDRLRTEHQWFYRLAHPLLKQAEDPAKAQQALTEVTVRERRIRAVTEQLYLEHEQGGPAGQQANVSSAALQGKLGDGVALVEYFNDGADWWAFTLTRQTIRAQRLPATVETIDRLLAQLQTNVEAALALGTQAPAAQPLAGLARRLLQRMYAALVAPLALEQHKSQRVIFVPYGNLHYLPFHALFDQGAYLIERWQVVVLPAAGLLTHAAPRRPPGALILACSDGGRLPETRTEAALVHGLFGGAVYEEAAAQLRALPATPAQILHIAAHGHYRLDQPDLSYIQLAEGQVYADDLLQQDLGYELVTLSACETGRAQAAPGDELIGLGRGFLYAGAGALLASLWRVGDEATIGFMQHFYESLSSGAAKAAALRQAQCALLDADRQLHPAFWGAFQLIGAAGPLSDGRTRSPEGESHVRS